VTTPTSNPHHYAVPGRELSAIGQRFPNVLLVGSRIANENALVELLPYCREPRHVEGGLAQRPDAGAVVVRDVETLDAAAQSDLARWIEQTSGRVQLITLTTAPLFSLVASGRFRPDLYYRLNVITITT